MLENSLLITAELDNVVTVRSISVSDRCYIPLMRATDNSSQPIIGAPWSPEPSESFSHTLSPRHARSPMDPLMSVKAFAGPLSPSKVGVLNKTGLFTTYQLPTFTFTELDCN